MGYRDLAGRVVIVRIFGGDVDLRAAAITGTRDAFANPLKLRIQLLAWRTLVLYSDRIPVLPEVFVLKEKEGFDQIIFRPEVTIQTRLGDTRLLHDKVDANRTRALSIEKFAGGPQNALARIRCGSARLLCLLHSGLNLEVLSC